MSVHDVDKLVRALCASSLGIGLSNSDCRHFVERVAVKQLEIGEVLFSETATGDAAYVLVEGKVRLTLLNSTHKVQLLDSMSAPDSLGEVALLRPGPRQCTATAETKAMVLVLSREVLWTMKSLHPELYLKVQCNVVERVGERLRDCDHELRQFLAWRLREV